MQHEQEQKREQKEEEQEEEEGEKKEAGGRGRRRRSRREEGLDELLTFAEPFRGEVGRGNGEEGRCCLHGMGRRHAWIAESAWGGG